MERQHTPFIRRLPAILHEALGILRGVIIYVLVGIGVGAAMHGYARRLLHPLPLPVKPAGRAAGRTLRRTDVRQRRGIVPVIQVFVAKGVPLGTALAFMMAVVGLSLPEATMLKKAMTWRLIAIFFGTVTLFIILGLPVQPGYCNGRTRSPESCRPCG